MGCVRHPVSCLIWSITVALGLVLLWVGAASVGNQPPVGSCEVRALLGNSSAGFACVQRLESGVLVWRPVFARPTFNGQPDVCARLVDQPASSQVACQLQAAAATAGGPLQCLLDAAGAQDCHTVGVGETNQRRNARAQASCLMCAGSLLALLAGAKVYRALRGSGSAGSADREATSRCLSTAEEEEQERAEYERLFPETTALADLPCIICLENIVEGEPCRRLQCAHSFHKSCLDTWWIRQQHSRLLCPTCKTRQSSGVSTTFV